MELDLCDVCESRKCAFCCFFLGRTPKVFSKSFSMGKEKTDFINEHSGRLKKKFLSYYTGLNKDVYLLNSNDFPFYACSFLNIEIKDGAVDSLSCIIHDSNFLPRDCANHPFNKLSFPSTCSEFFYKVRLKGVIVINDEEFSLNPDLLKLLARFYNHYFKCSSKYFDDFY
jgi:hypothetical protein